MLGGSDGYAYGSVNFVRMRALLLFMLILVHCNNNLYHLSSFLLLIHFYCMGAPDWLVRCSVPDLPT